MLFALLHHPPKVDALNLTLADIEGMEEGLAIKLKERLEEARRKTYEAYKSVGRR